MTLQEARDNVRGKIKDMQDVSYWEQLVKSEFPDRDTAVSFVDGKLSIKGLNKEEVDKIVGLGLRK